MADELELGPFEQAGEVARMLLPPELGVVSHRAHRRGVKVWLGGGECPKEHYEAQLVGRRHVDGLDGAAIEVGFHCERRDGAGNQAVLDALQTAESQWRGLLGDETTGGEFFGNDSWTRLSEVWLEPDFDDDDLGFEMGSRLADYILALEDLVAAERA